MSKLKVGDRVVNRTDRDGRDITIGNIYTVEASHGDNSIEFRDDVGHPRCRLSEDYELALAQAGAFKVGDKVTPKPEHRRLVVEYMDSNYDNDGRVVFTVNEIYARGGVIAIDDDVVWMADKFTLADESFNPGDIVEVTTNEWGAHQQGRIGEVVDVNRVRNLPISVEFENEEINLYRASDLALVVTDEVEEFEVGDRVIIVNNYEFRDEVCIGDEAIVWSTPTEFGDDYEIIVRKDYNTYLQVAKAESLAAA